MLAVHFNAIVRRFIIADLIWLAGWGLVSPIFALFVVGQVNGATIATVGIASALYWLLKSAVQIPVAFALDSTRTERDDYITLVIALMLAGCTALSFLVVREVWQLYVVEALHAISFALYVPAWNGIFSRHLDKRHRALEFAADSAAVGIGTGCAGLLGSIIAQIFGFAPIFIMTGFLSFIAGVIILCSPGIVFPKSPNNKGASMGDHTPRNIGR
jgi:MFS family permease